jgi:hypothetical protein
MVDVGHHHDSRGCGWNHRQEKVVQDEKDGHAGFLGRSGSLAVSFDQNHRTKRRDDIQMGIAGLISSVLARGWWVGVQVKPSLAMRPDAEERFLQADIGPAAILSGIQLMVIGACADVIIPQVSLPYKISNRVVVVDLY